MSPEPKFPMYPEKKPESAKPVMNSSQEGLSVGELTELQRTLVAFDEEFGKYIRGEKSTVDDDYNLQENLEKFLFDHPGVIKRGLRNKATRATALSIILSAQWIERGMSNRTSLDILNEDLVSEEASCEEELTHERDDTQDMVLEAVSRLLSQEPHLHQQSEYAEKFLMKHLKQLQESLFEDFGKLNQSSLPQTWQRMFLRFGRQENLQHIWKAFGVIWEAYPNKDWTELYREMLAGLRILRTRHNAEEIDQNCLFAMKSAIDLAGLDGSKLLKQWMLLGEDAGHSEVCQRKNLEALYALKQRVPEAPQELYERFGIVHFGRYKTEMLEDQFQERDVERPYGIVLFPYADHNGAFFEDKYKLHSLQQELRFEAHSGLRVIEAGSRAEVSGAIMRLDRAYGQGENGHKISFAIIGGHGTPESIQFGDAGKPGDRIFLDDIGGKRLTRGAQTFFEPGASIVLFSCSTGARAGIAEAMKNQYGWNLKAPDKPASVQEISVVVNPDGTFNFEVSYASGGNDVATMHYKPVEKDDIVSSH